MTYTIVRVVRLGRSLFLFCFCKYIWRSMNIPDKYFRLYLRDALKSYDLNMAEGLVLLPLFGIRKNGMTSVKNLLNKFCNN